MERRDADGVLTTGVYGPGKSSVAAEIAYMPKHRHQPCALLDPDCLSWAGTGGSDRAGEFGLLPNLADLIGNYRRPAAARRAASQAACLYIVSGQAECSLLPRTVGVSGVAILPRVVRHAMSVPYAVTVGVLFDYFAAPSAGAAADTIDWVGGPGRPPITTPSARRGLFGRRSNAPDAVPQAAYRTLSDTGIDPVVQAGTLENLLTGRAFDEILAANAGAQVAVRDGGQRLVMKVSDGLVDALSTATADSLANVAEPWSHTEEFWDAGNPEELAGFLSELAALARHARGEGQSVYCWTCV